MKYMASFIRKDTYGSFCLPELISICKMFNIDLKYDKEWSYDIIKDPLIEIEIPDIENNAKKIISRSILTDKILKVYSIGRTYEEVIEKINIDDIKDELIIDKSFRCDVDARGKVIDCKGQLEIFAKILTYLFSIGLKENVSMNNPERIFVIVENEKNGLKYFGKVIAKRNDGIKYIYIENALYYSQYSLQKRKYLGPTSTDNVLSFLMVNFNLIVVKSRPS
jgi:tRNA (guanine10-N2)-methyltransferase